MAKTMQDYFQQLNGRYFQAIFDPLIVIQCPDPITPKNIGESTIPAQNILYNKYHGVSPGAAHLYRKISKKKAERIKKDFESGLINKIEEDHFADLKADRPKPEK